MLKVYRSAGGAPPSYSPDPVYELDSENHMLKNVPKVALSAVFGHSAKFVNSQMFF